MKKIQGSESGQPKRLGTEVGGTSPAAAAGSDPGQLHVLLVDDHAPVLRFLSFAFTANGCAVATAATAEQALELLNDHSFDLIVSDIKMPGLSGLDLLQAVKSKESAIPVVLITGMPSVDSAVFGLRHQAYDYLTKPFSAEEVQRLIQRIRDEREKKTETNLSAAVAEELSRRQSGMEVLSQMWDLALQGFDPASFVEKALDATMQGLRGDAALIFLSDEDGQLTPNQKGDPELATELLSLVQASADDVRKLGEHEAMVLSRNGHQFTALAAAIPGNGHGRGIICLGRGAGRGPFLTDEKQFLVGYARTLALSLEKIVLGETLEANLIDTIASFITALESKDVYLKGHSARVSLYAGEIAAAMKLAPPQVAVTRRAGILHDLGKLVVMDSILQKPGRLTEEESVLMQSHPLNAAKILRPLRFLAQEAEAIKRHHERYDGKGYPDGLKGEEIPLAARIVTVADSFDAMTSTRPYRTRVTLDVAMAEVLQQARAQFDPGVTAAFASIPMSRLTEISRFYDNTAPSTTAETSISAPVNGTPASSRRLVGIGS